MGEGSDRPLIVIIGDRKTRQRRAGRRRALDQNEQITCWRCENDIGIATSMAVRVILAPRRTPMGRLVPGTEGWISAAKPNWRAKFDYRLERLAGENARARRC